MKKTKTIFRCDGTIVAEDKFTYRRKFAIGQSITEKGAAYIVTGQTVEGDADVVTVVRPASNSERSGREEHEIVRVTESLL